MSDGSKAKFVWVEPLGPYIAEAGLMIGGAVVLGSLWAASLFVVLPRVDGILDRVFLSAATTLAAALTWYSALTRQRAGILRDALVTRSRPLTSIFARRPFAIRPEILLRIQVVRIGNTRIQVYADTRDGGSWPLTPPRHAASALPFVTAFGRMNGVRMEEVSGSITAPDSVSLTRRTIDLVKMASAGAWLTLLVFVVVSVVRSDQGILVALVELAMAGLFLFLVTRLLRRTETTQTQSGP